MLPQHELIAVMEKGCPTYTNRGIPSVITYKRAMMGSTPDHPHQKPIDLMAYLIENFSLRGQTVLDPFAGSGSTLVAAKQLGRKYIGIEHEARYVELAMARLKAAGSLVA